MTEKMNETKEKRRISIPNYTLGEEIFNAISHGIGGLLGIIALILMLIKAKTPLARLLLVGHCHVRTNAKIRCAP